jgi:hypothetical protein
LGPRTTAWRVEDIRRLIESGIATNSFSARQGRPPDPGRSLKQLQIASEVVSMMQEGLPQKAAVSIVGENRGISESTVRRALKAWREKSDNGR